jgi:hypothetical protein
LLIARTTYVYATRGFTRRSTKRDASLRPTSRRAEPPEARQTSYPVAPPTAGHDNRIAVRPHTARGCWGAAGGTICSWTAWRSGEPAFPGTVEKTSGRSSPFASTIPKSGAAGANGAAR